jgi:hypothetical protein
LAPADESKKLANAVVARLGLTLVVLTSLSQMSVVWDYGYTPIMSFLLDYGSGIQQQVQESILKKQPAAMLGNNVDDCPTTVSGQRQIQGLSGSVKDNPTVVSKAISCQLSNMQKALGVVPMLGFQAFKSSGHRLYRRNVGTFWGGCGFCYPKQKPNVVYVDEFGCDYWGSAGHAGLWVAAYFVADLYD